MAAIQTIQLHASDIERLLGQITRYLAAVDEFRRQGCEPHWLPERLQR
jgi:hypothetical protein